MAVCGYMGSHYSQGGGGGRGKGGTGNFGCWGAKITEASETWRMNFFTVARNVFVFSA